MAAIRVRTKDMWEKLQVVGGLATGILVPLSIAVTGHVLATKLKDGENQLKYVEIATSLIRQEPSLENAALRNWAIDVLAKHSTSVPLSAEAQKELKERRVPIESVSWSTAIPIQLDWLALSSKFRCLA